MVVFETVLPAPLPAPANETPPLPLCDVPVETAPATPRANTVISDCEVAPTWVCPPEVNVAPSKPAVVVFSIRLTAAAAAASIVALDWSRANPRATPPASALITETSVAARVMAFPATSVDSESIIASTVFVIVLIVTAPAPANSNPLLVPPPLPPLDNVKAPTNARASIFEASRAAIVMSPALAVRSVSNTWTLTVLPIVLIDTAAPIEIATPPL